MRLRSTLCSFFVLVLLFCWQVPLRAGEQDPVAKCANGWVTWGNKFTAYWREFKAKQAEFTRLPYLEEPAFEMLESLQERSVSEYFKDIQVAPAGTGKAKLARKIKDLALNPTELGAFERDLDDYLTLCERVSPGGVGKSCGYDKSIFFKWWNENRATVLNRGSIDEMGSHTIGTLVAVHYPEAVKKAFLEKRDLPGALKLLVAPFKNHYVRAALAGVGKPVYGVIASFLATAWFTMKFTPTQVVFSGLANPYLGPLSDKSGQVGQSVSGQWALYFKQWLMGAHTAEQSQEIRNFSEAIAHLSEETRRIYDVEGMSSEEAWKSLNDLRAKWIAMGQKFNEIFPGYEQGGRGLWLEQVHQWPAQYSVNMASFDHFQKDYEESEARLTDEIVQKYKISPETVHAFVNFYEAERKEAGGDLSSDITALQKRSPEKTGQLLSALQGKGVPVAMIGQLLRYREGKLVNETAAGEMLATWMLRYFTFAEVDRVLKSEKAEVEDVRKRLGFYFYRRKFLEQFLEALQNEQVVMDQLAGASTFYADHKRASASP